jgi:hypothetical protein
MGLWDLQMLGQGNKYTELFPERVFSILPGNVKESKNLLLKSKRPLNRTRQFTRQVRG